jgi:FkbM family methyltransferase
MEVFPESQYTLIDALDENRAALASFCRKHKNARYIIVGLGPAESRGQLHVHGDQSSFLSSEYDEKGMLREILIKSLDELVERNEVPLPNLIKADVQGYELEILKGGIKTLQAAELVLLEVSFRQVYRQCPLADEVVSTMADYGFRIYDICTYSQRPRDGELFQSDVLFARRESKIFGFEGYT